MSPPILIVGAGPAGLCLALTLVKNGVHVRIIDKGHRHRVGRKGYGVQPRTIEVHKFLGTEKAVIQSSAPLLSCRVYDTDGHKVLKEIVLAERLDTTSAIPWGGPLALGQDVHEAIFRSSLEKLGTAVELGTELVSFEQTDDHVIARIKHTTSAGLTDKLEDAKFRWIAGADGGHSVVRKQSAFSFSGDPVAGKTLVTGDIIITKGLDRSSGHLWGNDDAWTIVLFPSEIPNSTVFTFSIFGDAIDAKKMVESRGEWLKCFYELTKRTDVEFGEFVWISQWGPNVRMADTFQKGNVFILGDAAHCHTPAGGQGLNSSVQDAINLGWKLALVQKNLAPLSLLQSYSAERLPVIAAMLGKSTLVYQNNMQAKHNDEASWKRGAEMMQLGVNYRTSPILVDEFHQHTDPADYDAYGTKIGVVTRGEDLRAGDRAPEATHLKVVSPDGDDKNKATLFDFFGVDHHTILVFTHNAVASGSLNLPNNGLGVRVVYILSQSSTAPVAMSSADTVVVVDENGFAFDSYTTAGDGGERVVVVRPDGIVGALLKGKEGLKKYWQKVLL